MSPQMLRIVEREATIFRRLWHGQAFTAFVQPLLYLLAMGVGIGGYVDARSSSAIGGITYLQFVAPGLLAATAFQLGVADSLWWVMGGSKWDKRYHAMVSSPLTPTDVMVSHLAWVAIRTAVAGVPFLVVAAALGGLHSWWSPLAVPAAVLLVVAVASLVATWSTTTEDDTTFPLVMRFGVLPLFLFSGTFFPTGNLGALRHVAPISPLYHGVELCRAATTGHVRSAGALVVHVGFLALVATAGTLLARRSFNRRLAP